MSNDAPRGPIILPDDDDPRLMPTEMPPWLVDFHRQVDAMQWRVNDLRPTLAPSSPEAIEALESTLEELQIAVEELRLANDALRDSRAEVEKERRRYRDLFDRAPDAYLVTDLRGVVREANWAASVLFRIEHRFLIGKPMIVFIPDEGRLSFRTELARFREATGTEECDLRLAPRGFAPFEAAVRVDLVRETSGQPVALRWLIRDISARKRAEEEIRLLNARLELRVAERSEQLESVLQTNERWLIKAHAADAETQPEGRLFEEIVHEADAIFWRADAATGRFTFVSRRAEQMLGFPVARWLDEPDFWLDHVHPEDRDFAGAYRRKQIREGSDHEAEYRVVAADGRTIWFRESVRILKHEPGTPAVLCGLMVNISKRKKVERQLYTAKGELATQLRDMTYLHELGGRLAGVRGLPATLDEILSAAFSLQGASMGIVLLREPEKDGLAIAASVGLPDEFSRFLGQGPHDPGALGQLLGSRKPVFIEDVETETTDPSLRSAGKVGGFRAVVGIPLFTREGEFLGAIATFFKTPYRPPDGLVRLVELYAEHAADAIEAARFLSTRAREMNEPLEALLEAVRSFPHLDGADPAREAIEQKARDLAGLIEESSILRGPTPRNRR